MCNFCGNDNAKHISNSVKACSRCSSIVAGITSQPTSKLGKSDDADLGDRYLPGFEDMHK